MAASDSAPSTPPPVTAPPPLSTVRSPLLKTLASLFSVCNLCCFSSSFPAFSLSDLYLFFFFPFICVFLEEGESDTDKLKDHGILRYFSPSFQNLPSNSILFVHLFVKDLNESRSELLTRIQGLKLVIFFNFFF